MAEPFAAGAVHDTVIWLTLPSPTGASGVSGTPAGVTAPEEAVDPYPIELVALTRSVYEVPLTRPVASHAVALEVVVTVGAHVPLAGYQTPAP